MLRSLLLSAAILPSLALASATGAYTPGASCPAAGCADVIDVRLQAPRGTGAIFVAILPIKNGEPTLPGAWLTGPEMIAIGQMPMAAKSGAIGPYQQRFRIRGGACALAAQQGVPTGTFKVYAGYGIAPAEIVESMNRIEQRVANADPEARAKASEAINRMRSLNPIAQAASSDMLAKKTWWPVATITCGEGG